MPAYIKNYVAVSTAELMSFVSNGFFIYLLEITGLLLQFDDIFNVFHRHVEGYQHLIRLQRYTMKK